MTTLDLAQRYKIHRGLAWTMISLHFTVGFGFFAKISAIDNPSAYMIGPLGKEKPGDGTTLIENLARIKAGILYTAPFIAVVYAELNGSKDAKRAAAICPILYHLCMTIELIINADILNPKVMPVSTAVGGNLVFALLCCGLFYFAEDSPFFTDKTSQ